jgi:GNAT superfamily N-acetyltransferase
MTIRQIRKTEIIKLQKFPPEDWNLDLPQLIYLHYGFPYFYPAVAVADNKIVGCGIASTHKNIGWLGTIIVLPEYRRQGIGQEITRHLMEYCKSKGCSTLLLTASEMGEPIYLKLGFRISSTYVFYRRVSFIERKDTINIRNIEQNDVPQIKKIDIEITGEKRFPFIKKFFSTGRIYTKDMKGAADGIYLPDLGNGLILAKSSEAGLELMKSRINDGRKSAVVPSTNVAARDYLISEGMEEYRIAPRMIFGEEIKWKPEMIYNRGTGYCG